MKMKLLAAAAALSLGASATAAHADTLTFSDLFGCYGSGEGCPMLPNMTFDGTNLTYTSGDYLLSFAGGVYAHIGDGTNVAGTFNWHDGPDNAVGTVLSLSRIDGTAFDLVSFDYSSGNLLVAAPGFGLAASGSGTVSAGFTNITTATFTSPGTTTQLDNIVLNAATGAVPEPATWALMMLGFGGLGHAMRRKAKVSSRLRFA